MYVHMNADVVEAKERVGAAGGVSSLMWMLGTELGSQQARFVFLHH